MRHASVEFKRASLREKERRRWEVLAAMRDNEGSVAASLMQLLLDMQARGKMLAWLTNA